MKSKDFRKGNFVKNKELDIFKVGHVELEARHIYEMAVKESAQGYAGYVDKFKRIPITENYLKAFGFEKLTDKNTGFKQSSYSLDNGALIVNFDSGVLEVDFYRGLNYRYVHQLQNLYYALTGKELMYDTTKQN